jgi:hypothetical protein
MMVFILTEYFIGFVSLSNLTKEIVVKFFCLSWWHRIVVVRLIALQHAIQCKLTYYDPEH